MNIIWNRDGKKAACGDNEFDIASEVRNELNGRRALHSAGEVVRTITKERTQGEPYMPRPFPKGTWEITGIEITSNPIFAPVKIRTDAHQQVEVWILDAAGGYEKQSGKFIEDYGYHLHWSKDSKTTLGCGRVGRDSYAQALKLAGLIQEAFDKNEKVFLEVT